jgi:hypothetical protein
MPLLQPRAEQLDICLCEVEPFIKVGIKEMKVSVDEAI